MVHQLVVGSAQHGVARKRAKTGTVNQALRMLDAKAHAKGFGLHVHALGMQHLKRIARAVPYGQHHMVSLYLGAVFYRYTFDSCLCSILYGLQPVFLGEHR